MTLFGSVVINRFTPTYRPFKDAVMRSIMPILWRANAAVTWMATPAPPPRLHFLGIGNIWELGNKPLRISDVLYGQHELLCNN